MDFSQTPDANDARFELYRCLFIASQFSFEQPQSVAELLQQIPGGLKQTPRNIALLSPFLNIHFTQQFKARQGSRTPDFRKLYKRKAELDRRLFETDFPGPL